MVSVMDSMRVTKETSHMREQGVPGSLSDFFECLGMRLGKYNEKNRVMLWE